MSAPKNDENLGLRRNSVLNRRGFTLVELMVTAVVSMVVALGIGSFTYYVAEQFEILLQENRVQEDVMQAAFRVRYYMNQAINVRGSTQGTGGGANPLVSTAAAMPPVQPLDLDPIGATAGDTTGWVGGMGVDIDGPCAFCPSYRSDTLPENGVVDLPAYFSAEMNTRFNNAQYFVPVAIFFRRPNAGTGVENSGAIAFDADFDPAAPGPGLAKEATFQDLTFENLVSLRIDVTPLDITAPQGPAKSAVVTITGRYFKTMDKTLWSYSAAGPAAGVPYRDYSLSFPVGFRNNPLRESQIAGAGVVERLHGNLYYFRMTMPSKITPIHVN